MNKPKPRLLRFNTPDQVIADVDRLRANGYHKLRNWSLPQACRHVALTIEMNLTPPPTNEPTPEQLAVKKGFFDMVMNPAGMPENRPTGPALIPPETCGDEEIEHLKTALKALTDYPHPCILVGKCGPVPTDEIRTLHLYHAAHHLGFLLPKNAKRAMKYADTDAVAADVQILRKGYETCGTWTLPQACRHLTVSIHRSSKPATEPATQEQLDRRPFLEHLMNGGSLPPGVQAPESTLPPPDCTDADIDAFITALDIVKNYSEPTASHRLFGPLTNEQHRRLFLIHSAHHLGHFAPTTNG